MRFSIQTEELFRHNFFSEDLYFGLHSKGRVWYDNVMAIQLFIAVCIFIAIQLFHATATSLNCIAQLTCVNLEKQELDFVIIGAESGFFSGNCLRYRAGCVILKKIIFNFN